MDLELLLARADDHAPILQGGLPLTSIASEPKPASGVAHGESLLCDSGDPNDLRLQRWGIVAPEGAGGDRLLALIEPLRLARQQQQGGAAVIVYRVPAGMDSAAAAQWKDQVYRSDATPLADVPRYLLIVGDLDEVSLEMQQSLATDAFVGRLAFRSDDGYTAYVTKLLRSEQTPPVEERAPLVFFTVRDGSDATSTAQSALVTPSIARCQLEQGRGVLPVKEIVQLPYDPAAPAAAFLERAAQGAPTIMFTVSHGLGPPRGGWQSTDDQRARQGAMVLGSAATDRLLADDVAKRPFLPGGVWFFLACFGGAVPATSVYEPWLQRLKDAGAFPGRVDSVLEGLPRKGDRPFVSALPQAALANPDGPIAVMAHADLAWTYAFQDVGADAKDRPSRFEGLFRALADASHVGPCHREVLRVMTETTEELLTYYASDETANPSGPPDPKRTVEKANLWMLRQDLAGYILLGDPAARLSLRAPAAPVDPPGARTLVPATDPSADPPPAAGATPSAPCTPPRDPAAMAEAVVALIRGDDSEKNLAARLGITGTELVEWRKIYQDAGQAALAKLR